MSRKNLSNNKDRIRRERDPIPWRYCLLTLVCGLILVVGFFFAARQHFSSIDFGIKNSKLKKQKDELEAAQRQLLLTKEIALSPNEIKKAAKKIGLTEMTAANIQVFSSESDEKRQKPKTEKTDETKPVNAFLPTSVDKKIEKQPQKEAKVEKKSVDSKDKKSVRETKTAK
jgi:hypothetical protein